MGIARAGGPGDGGFLLGCRPPHRREVPHARLPIPRRRRLPGRAGAARYSRMCGLVALARWPGRADAQRMRLALDRLAHRGPDAEGMLSRWDGRLLLGHRRLAIFDTAAAAHQPMLDPASGNGLIFNGAIYNYRELRGELEGLGATFRTGSDTEVILHAWRYWREDAFRRFNGMWALALHDAGSDRLYLCRDRLGVKPLYCFRSPTCLAVASEIRAVLAASGGEARIDPHAALDFLALGLLDHRPASFYRDVVEVPPGALWCVHPDGFIARTRFHEWPDADPALGLEQAAEALPALLEDAVALRLRSDVPLAAQLSGGMDSGSVAWAIGRRGSAPERFLGFFSYGYADAAGAEHDETDAARRTLERVAPGLSQHVVAAESLPTLDELQRLIAVQELPVATPSILAGWRLMRAIREAGAKVVLTGDGSDELFAGYTRRYLPLALRRALGGLDLRQAARLLAGGHLQPGAAARRLAWELPWPLLARLLRRQPHVQVIAPGFLDEMAGAFRALADLQRQPLDTQGPDDVRRVLLPQILRYGDRNAMAWGVESRSPFLDHRVAELAMRLPTSSKVGPTGGKLPLRMAMSGRLPDALVRGRKDRGLGNAEQFQVGAMDLSALFDEPPAGSERFIDLARLREQLRRHPRDPRLWWPVCLLLWMRWLQAGMP